MPLKADQASFDFTEIPNDPLRLFEKTREEARFCRNCHLWERATQTVFGEGPVPAPIMLIGEQPGDKEDLRGNLLSARRGKSSIKLSPMLELIAKNSTLQTRSSISNICREAAFACTKSR